VMTVFVGPKLFPFNRVAHFSNFAFLVFLGRPWQHQVTLK